MRLRNKHPQASLLRQNSKYLRLAALITLTSFLVSNVSYATPDLQSVGHSILSRAEWQRQNLISTLDIPVELGTIRERYVPDGPTQLSVIHIQDAHANDEAQKNIEQLVEKFSNEKQFSTLLLEGGAETLDPSLLQIFKREETNQKFIEELVRRGEVTGSESFLVRKSYQKSSKQHAHAYGLESSELYRHDIEFFRKLWPQLTNGLDFSNELILQIERSVTREVNPHLRSFISGWQRFKNSENDLASYITSLANTAKTNLLLDLNEASNQREWPNLTRLFKIKELETQYKSEDATREWNTLKDSLKQLHVDGILAELEHRIKNKGPSRENNEATTRSLFEQLFEKTFAKGFRFEKYPMFSALAGILILQDEIEADGTFEEIEKLHELIFQALAKTDAEKKLIRMIRNAYLLRSLFKLEISREDYEKLRADAERHSPSYFANEIKTLDVSSGINISSLTALDQLYWDSLKSYDNAVRREQAFMDNMIAAARKSKQDRLIVVAGGFHTAGLTEMLKQKNISYAVVAPKISDLSHAEKNHDHYIQSLLQIVKEDFKNLRTAPLKINVNYEAVAGIPLYRAETFRAAAQAIGVRSELRATESTTDFIELSRADRAVDIPANNIVWISIQLLDNYGAVTLEYLLTPQNNSALEVHEVKYDTVQSVLLGVIQANDTMKIDPRNQAWNWVEVANNGNQISVTQLEGTHPEIRGIRVEWRYRTESIENPDETTGQLTVQIGGDYAEVEIRDDEVILHFLPLPNRPQWRIDRRSGQISAFQSNGKPIELSTLDRGKVQKALSEIKSSFADGSIVHQILNHMLSQSIENAIGGDSSDRSELREHSADSVERIADTKTKRYTLNAKRSKAMRWLERTGRTAALIAASTFLGPIQAGCNLAGTFDQVLFTNSELSFNSPLVPAPLAPEQAGEAKVDVSAFQSEHAFASLSIEPESGFKNAIDAKITMSYNVIGAPFTKNHRAALVLDNIDLKQWIVNGPNGREILMKWLGSITSLPGTADATAVTAVIFDQISGKEVASHRFIVGTEPTPLVWRVTDDIFARSEDPDYADVYQNVDPNNPNGSSPVRIEFVINNPSDPLELFGQNSLQTLNGISGLLTSFTNQAINALVALFSHNDVKPADLIGTLNLYVKGANVIRQNPTVEPGQVYAVADDYEGSSFNGFRPFRISPENVSNVNIDQPLDQGGKVINAEIALSNDEQQFGGVGIASPGENIESWRSFGQDESIQISGWFFQDTDEFTLTFSTGSFALRTQKQVNFTVRRPPNIGKDQKVSVVIPVEKFTEIGMPVEFYQPDPNAGTTRLFVSGAAISVSKGQKPENTNVVRMTLDVPGIEIGAVESPDFEVNNPPRSELRINPAFSVQRMADRNGSESIRSTLSAKQYRINRAKIWVRQLFVIFLSFSVSGLSGCGIFDFLFPKPPPPAVSPELEAPASFAPVDPLNFATDAKNHRLGNIGQLVGNRPTRGTLPNEHVFTFVDSEQNPSRGIVLDTDLSNPSSEDLRNAAFLISIDSDQDVIPVAFEAKVITTVGNVTQGISLRRSFNVVTEDGGNRLWYPIFPSDFFSDNANPITSFVVSSPLARRISVVAANISNIEIMSAVQEVIVNIPVPVATSNIDASQTNGAQQNIVFFGNNDTPYPIAIDVFGIDKDPTLTAFQTWGSGLKVKTASGTVNGAHYFIKLIGNSPEQVQIRATDKNTAKIYVVNWVLRPELWYLVDADAIRAGTENPDLLDMIATIGGGSSNSMLQIALANVANPPFNVVDLPLVQPGDQNGGTGTVGGRGTDAEHFFGSRDTFSVTSTSPKTLPTDTLGLEITGINFNSWTDTHVNYGGITRGKFKVTYTDLSGIQREKEFVDLSVETGVHKSIRDQVAAIPDLDRTKPITLFIFVSADNAIPVIPAGTTIAIQMVGAAREGLNPNEITDLTLPSDPSNGNPDGRTLQDGNLAAIGAEVSMTTTANVYKIAPTELNLGLPVGPHIEGSNLNGISVGILNQTGGDAIVDIGFQRPGDPIIRHIFDNHVLLAGWQIVNGSDLLSRVHAIDPAGNTIRSVTIQKIVKQTDTIASHAWSVAAHDVANFPKALDITSQNIFFDPPDMKKDTGNAPTGFSIGNSSEVEGPFFTSYTGDLAQVKVELIVTQGSGGVQFEYANNSVNAGGLHFALKSYRDVNGQRTVVPARIKLINTTLPDGHSEKETIFVVFDPELATDSPTAQSPNAPVVTIDISLLPASFDFANFILQVYTDDEATIEVYGQNVGTIAVFRSELRRNAVSRIWYLVSRFPNLIQDTNPGRRRFLALTGIAGISAAISACIPNIFMPTGPTPEDALKELYDRLKGETQSAAAQDYIPPQETLNPDFVTPKDGKRTSQGLTATEHNDAIRTVRRALDNGREYADARPVGDTDIRKLNIHLWNSAAAKFEKLTFEQNRFNAASSEIIPPLPAIWPDDVLFYTRVNLGGRRQGFASSSPVYFTINADGYMRMAAADGTTMTEFGSSFRFFTMNVGTPNETFPNLKDIYLVPGKADGSAGFRAVMRFSNEAFEAVLDAEFGFGLPSQMKIVRGTLIPRRDIQPGELGIGVSSFYKDPKEHDADTVLIGNANEVQYEISLTNPSRPSFGILPGGNQNVVGFRIEQQDRNPQNYTMITPPYDRRSSIGITKIVVKIEETLAGISARLFGFHAANANVDNIVVYATVEELLRAGTPVSLKYEVSAYATRSELRAISTLHSRRVFLGTGIAAVLTGVVGGACDVFRSVFNNAPFLSLPRDVQPQAVEYYERENVRIPIVHGYQGDYVRIEFTSDELQTIRETLDKLPIEHIRRISWIAARSSNRAYLQGEAWQSSFGIALYVDDNEHPTERPKRRIYDGHHELHDRFAEEHTAERTIAETSLGTDLANVLRHEVGHIVQFQLKADPNYGALIRQWQALYQESRIDANGNTTGGPTWDAYWQEISLNFATRFAITNELEDWAETYERWTDRPDALLALAAEREENGHPLLSQKVQLIASLFNNEAELEQNRSELRWLSQQSTVNGQQEQQPKTVSNHDSRTTIPNAKVNLRSVIAVAQLTLGIFAVSLYQLPRRTLIKLGVIKQPVQPAAPIQINADTTLSAIEPAVFDTHNPAAHALQIRIAEDVPKDSIGAVSIAPYLYDLEIAALHPNYKLTFIVKADSTEAKLFEDELSRALSQIRASRYNLQAANAGQIRVISVDELSTVEISKTINAAYAKENKKLAGHTAVVSNDRALLDQLSARSGIMLIHDDAPANLNAQKAASVTIGKIVLDGFNAENTYDIRTVSGLSEYLTYLGRIAAQEREIAVKA